MQARQSLRSMSMSSTEQMIISWVSVAYLSTAIECVYQVVGIFEAGSRAKKMLDTILAL